MDFHKQAQEYYALAPTIILGSGASAAHGLPGMWHLAEHLQRSISVEPESGSDHSNWEKLTELLRAGTDLESALHQVTLSQALSDKVVRSSWELINPQDLLVFENSIRDPDHLPLTRLLKSMFQSANAQIDIVTTNYDRLAEYACDQGKIHHNTGFSSGYFRLPTDPRQVVAGRQVNIWKVHGSLDWFKHPAGDTCGLGQRTDIPDDFQPQIVTPGINKYQATYHEPHRTVIAQADIAIERARSFICVGFGFNDEHIQEKLVNKCVREKTPIIVLTKDLTPSAKEFLLSQKVDNFIAIESSDEGGSTIYSSIAEDPVNIEPDYWSLAGFINLVT